MNETIEVKQVKPHEFTNGGDKVLILRRCSADGTSREGKFQWPTKVGEFVEAPDWKPTAFCGNGLHGWPWGMGLGEGMDFDVIHDLFIVFACDPSDVVGELENGLKCKAKQGTVVEVGSFGKCWDKINAGRDALIVAMSKDESTKDIASGYSSTAASSGDYSKAASSGYSSKAASSGNYSKAASSGYYSTAASSGNYSTAASSGNSSTAASSGDYSKAASSGDSSTAASSGDYSTAASSGDYSKAASSGYSSTAASSGDYSKAASSGDYSKAASSGNYSKAASSGDYSKAASSGNYSKAEAIGDRTMAASVGIGGRAKAGLKGCFAIGFEHEDGGLDFAVGRIGFDGIKADTWYQVQDGKLIEVVS